MQLKYYKNESLNGNYPESIIENPVSDIFVACENTTENKEKILGFVHVRKSGSPPFENNIPNKHAEIADLIVDKDFRGMGIGKELLESSKNWAAGKNIDYNEMMIVNENINGIDFSLNEGFCEILKP